VRSVDRSAARRWARALLDVVLEREKAGGAGPAELAHELSVFVNLLRENHDLAVALAHPAIANDRRKGIGEAICASARASEILTRLIQMLIERQRVAWLPEITALYTELWNAYRGVARAEASTVAPLEGEMLASLGQALGKATGLAVEVAGRTDPEILGGVLVRMGGKTFDGTVRSRLKSLRQTLTQGA